MIESSPFAAASRVRATGASAKKMPLAVRRAPISRVSATEEVLVSTTHWPGFRCGSNAATTPAIAFPSGSDIRIRSARSAICSSVAAVTPSDARRASGSGRRSDARIGLPPRRARWPHMGSPMTPRPMKPIVMTGLGDAGMMGRLLRGGRRLFILRVPSSLPADHGYLGGVSDRVYKARGAEHVTRLVRTEGIGFSCHSGVLTELCRYIWA